MILRSALIVDDEAEIRETISEQLLMEEWQVQEAANGVQALERLQNQKFSVIISDIRMPKMDGIAFLQAARDRNVDSIFVLMSAFADVSLWAAYSLGADAYLGKPFGHEELSSVLSRLMEPLEKRWKSRDKLPLNVEPTAHISQHCSRQESLSLGRGGFFIESMANQVRKGQFVTFDIKAPHVSIAGIGRILWKRTTKEPNLLPGLGVEYFYLEKSTNDKICEAIRSSRERCYIPLGLLAASGNQ